MVLPGPPFAMSVIRTVAVHEVVRAAYPRPVLEGQEIGLAAGKAVDAALSQYSHEHAHGRRPGIGAMTELAQRVFDEEIAAAGAVVAAEDRQRALAPIPEMLREFRRSALFDLPRPRARVILVNSRAGIYAQPDFWDRRSRIFELKSYRADRLKPEIALQLRLFQIAFPGFLQSLVCIDRHATPVRTTIDEVPAPTPDERDDALRLALKVAVESGTDRVFEYIDNPMERYTVPE